MKANSVDVAIVPHPFAVERIHHAIGAGRSVADIIHQLQPDAVLARHAHVYLNGDYIPQEQWSCVKPKAGAVLSIRLVPMGGGGGKNALRTVLSLAVMVAAPQMIPAGMTFMGLNISAGLATGVNLLTRLAMNALAPPPKPRFNSGDKESPSLFIQGARNQASPFARVPKVLGKHRFVPPLGAFPYTETVGNDQYMRMLFVWGYGPLEISDLKIGETPLSDFEEVQIETRQGYADDAP
ncbi:MAG: phage tail protein, partial [Alphaproteobacteria bacterium]|nr:phage tail protein [Alphaproteobacteria bacterium]